MSRQFIVRWTMLALVSAAFLSSSVMAEQSRSGRSLAGKTTSPRLKEAVRQAASEYSTPQLRGVDEIAAQEEGSVVEDGLLIHSYGFVRKHPYDHPSYVHPTVLRSK